MKKLQQIIAENMLRFGSKNLSENNVDAIKKLNEQQEDGPGDDGTVTKSKGVGFQTPGRRNRMRGVSKGGAIGGINYTVTKEKDVELVTPTDMLNKMQSDLAESEDYKKLSIDIKNSLAEGYYNVLLEILNGKAVENLSGKAGRDIRKFFRKSQRWAFEPMETNEENLKIKLTSNKELTEQELQEASNIISNSLNDLNIANSTAGTIAANMCNTARIYENDLEFISTKKDPLTTILVNIEKGLGQKKVKDERIVAFIKPVTLEIPKNTKVFAVGKFQVTEASKMANDIVNQILNNTFSVTEGKITITKTGREIIDGGGVFKVTNLNTISSASNFWGGATDFSHENNGNEVKPFDSISSTGNSGKNKKLAKDRNKSLTDAVVLELRKRKFLDLSQINYTREVRVTDTGGFVDENPKKDKNTHPNPGQYGQLGLSIGGEIEYQETKPGVYTKNAEFHPFGIRLRYIGKRDTERQLTAGLITGGKDKAQILKAKPIRTALQNLGVRMTDGQPGKPIFKQDIWAPKTGGDTWHDRRNRQNQKKVGNR